MNNIKAGADIHAGDGGYEIGTQEKYEAFVNVRNQSLAKIKIKELIEQCGLKYHNWTTNESNVSAGNFKYPRLEDYEKFAELIVQECVLISRTSADGFGAAKRMEEQFGVKL